VCTDALDGKLDTHHIIDYAADGPTVAWNLATVCERCDDGIAPDDRETRWNLGQKADRMRAPPRTAFAEGVARFRELVRASMRADVERMSAKPQSVEKSPGESADRTT
jgi:hypothetical protein